MPPLQLFELDLIDLLLVHLDIFLGEVAELSLDDSLELDGVGHCFHIVTALDADNQKLVGLDGVVRYERLTTTLPCRRQDTIQLCCLNRPRRML